MTTLPACSVQDDENVERTPAEMNRDPCPFDEPPRCEQPERTKGNDVPDIARASPSFSRGVALNGRHCLAPKKSRFTLAPGLSRWQLYTYQFARVDRSTQLTPPAALDDDRLQMRRRLPRRTHGVISNNAVT